MTAYKAAQARRAHANQQGTCPCQPARLKKDDPRLWTPTELAAYLRVSEAQLGQWRHKRMGPPFIKTGGLVRYAPAAIEQWLDTYTTQPKPGSPREEATVRRHVTTGLTAAASERTLRAV